MVVARAQQDEAVAEGASREVIVHSVDRAINILEALKSTPGELGISELASMLDLYKGTVREILVTLELRGLVRRNENTKKYQLGPALVEYGEAVLRRMDWRIIVHPVLEELKALTGETVLLSILVGASVLVVDQVASGDPRRLEVAIGHRLPLATAPSKVMLAQIDESTLTMILARVGLPQHTSKSITDEMDYRAALDQVRQEDYAIDDEEMLDGVRGVAAPIRDHRGRAIAALSVAGLTLRLTDERIPELIDQTLAAAARASSRLGGA